MRFGVLYEIHTPKPWHENSDYERNWQCIDEIKLAEAFGFDNAWAVEHHFIEEFAHRSAPEVFLTAITQHTTRDGRESSSWRARAGRDTCG